jgi:hypothetical protein
VIIGGHCIESTSSAREFQEAAEQAAPCEKILLGQP